MISPILLATPADPLTSAMPISPVMLLTIFILAIFIGFEIITKVPPMLHTPLTSGANAISGITIVGALMAAHAGYRGWDIFAYLLAFIAIVFAMINVVGGYLVTDRMLRMFRSRRADTSSTPPDTSTKDRA